MQSFTRQLRGLCRLNVHSIPNYRHHAFHSVMHACSQESQASEWIRWNKRTLAVCGRRIFVTLSAYPTFRAPPPSPCTPCATPMCLQVLRGDGCCVLWRRVTRSVLWLFYICPQYLKDGQRDSGSLLKTWLSNHSLAVVSRPHGHVPKWSMTELTVILRSILMSRNLKCLLNKWRLYSYRRL